MFNYIWTLFHCKLKLQAIISIYKIKLIPTFSNKVTFNKYKRYSDFAKPNLDKRIMFNIIRILIVFLKRRVFTQITMIWQRICQAMISGIACGHISGPPIISTKTLSCISVVRSRTFARKCIMKLKMPKQIQAYSIVSLLNMPITIL